MKITDKIAEKLLKGSFERGQAAVSLGSSYRKEILKELLIKTNSSSVSGAIFTAIEYYLEDCHPEK